MDLARDEDDDFTFSEFDHENHVMDGERFFSLQVVALSGYHGSTPYYRFQCICGRDKRLFHSLDEIYDNDIRDCGCAGRLFEPPRQPEELKCRLRRLLSGMKQRCGNEKSPSYKTYGARGITVCDQWMDSSDEFIDWAVRNGYRQGLEIDRIDNHKGYSPDNCRFVTKAVNQVNKRFAVRVKHAGEEMTLAEWGWKIDVPWKQIEDELRSGTPVEKAMNPLWYRPIRAEFVVAAIFIYVVAPNHLPTH